MSENEPSAAALEAAEKIVDIERTAGGWFVPALNGTRIGISYPANDGGKKGAAFYRLPIARALDTFAAARVAEAVAAERARISVEMFAHRVIHEDNLQYVPLWVALDIVEGKGEERAKDEASDDYARTDAPTDLVHWEDEE